MVEDGARWLGYSTRRQLQEATTTSLAPSERVLQVEVEPAEAAQARKAKKVVRADARLLCKVMAVGAIRRIAISREHLQEEEKVIGWRQDRRWQISL